MRAVHREAAKWAPQLVVVLDPRLERRLQVVGQAFRATQAIAAREGELLDIVVPPLGRQVAETELVDSGVGECLEPVNVTLRRMQCHARIRIAETN